MDVFDLVAKITVDTSEYEKGLDGASKDSKSFASKLGSGLKGAAKVGAVALTAVTTAGAVLGKTLVKGANEVATYGDNVDKMSQKMGISAKAYQEWDAILQHSGTSIDSMNRGMQTLQKNAVNSADKFAKLGLSQEQVASMSTEDLFAATIKGLQDMDEGAERTALANELLGGSAKELGALLNTSAEDTEKMRQRVHELGGVMSDEAVKSAAKFKDNLQDMQTAISGIKRSLSAEFLPALSDLMDGFTKLLTGEEGAEQALDSGMQKMEQAIDKVIPKIGTLLEKILPRVVSLGATVIGQLAQQIPKIVVAIAKQIPTVIKGLLQAIQKVIPEMFKAGVEILNALADGLSDPSNLIDMILDLLNTLINTIVENLPKIIDAGLRIIEGLATGIVNNLDKIVGAILQGIQVLIETIVSNLPQILAKGKDILLNLVRGIVDNIPKIIEAIIQTITTLVSTIIEHLPEILEAGVEIIVELARGLIEAIPKLVARLPEIITALVGGLLSPDNIGKILDAGLQMIGKLFEGLLSGDFLGALGDIAGALLGAVGAAAGALLELGGKIVGKILEGIKGAWNSVVNFVESGLEALLGNPLEKYQDPNYQAPVIEGYDEKMLKNAQRNRRKEAISSSSSYAATAQRYTSVNNTYIGGKRVNRTVSTAGASTAATSGGR